MASLSFPSSSDSTNIIDRKNLKEKVGQLSDTQRKILFFITERKNFLTMTDPTGPIANCAIQYASVAQPDYKVRALKALVKLRAKRQADAAVPTGGFVSLTSLRCLETMERTDSMFRSLLNLRPRTTPLTIDGEIFSAQIMAMRDSHAIDRIKAMDLAHQQLLSVLSNLRRR